jgi:hypothetical protein
MRDKAGPAPGREQAIALAGQAVATARIITNPDLQAQALAQVAEMLIDKEDTLCRAKTHNGSDLVFCVIARLLSRTR